MWHDEIYQEAVEGMPINLPGPGSLRDRIDRVVEELQNLELTPAGLEIAGLAARRRLAQLEKELDDLIFELYGLGQSERDLVREMCSLGLDFFYRHHESDAVKAVVLPSRPWGTYADVAQSDSGFGAYVQTFLQAWNVELEPDGELAWRVLSPPSGAPLLAVSFVSRFKNKPLTAPAHADAEAWGDLIKKLERGALLPYGSSNVFTDTFFRQIGEHEMLFIKRNEARFWTRTAAREDAEAALVRLMHEDGAGTKEGQ